MNNDNRTLDDLITEYEALERDIQSVIDNEPNTHRSRLAVAHMEYIRQMLKTMKLARFGVPKAS